MPPSLLNGSYSDGAGWADDPFVEPEALESAVSAMERSRRREAQSFAALRPTLGAAADARLGGNDYRVMLLALERVTDYRLAAFGRGEIGEILDMQPSAVARALRRLKAAGVIKPNSGSEHIYFADHSYEDDGAHDE